MQQRWFRLWPLWVLAVLYFVAGVPGARADDRPPPPRFSGAEQRDALPPNTRPLPLPPGGWDYGATPAAPPLGALRPATQPDAPISPWGAAWPLASAAAIAALIAVAGARREVQALATDLPIAASPPPVAGGSPAVVTVTRLVTETEYRDVPETVTETHIEHVPVSHTVTKTEYQREPVTVTETIQEPHYETVRVPDPPPDDIDLRGRRWMVQRFHTERRLTGYENRTVTHTEMRTVPVQVQETVTEYEDRPVTTTATHMVRQSFPVTHQETVLQPAAPAPAPVPPLRHRRSSLELAEERDAQRNSNVAPLFPLDSKPSEQELNRLILQAKQEYDIAQAQGIAGGMQAAHQRAEWLRSLGGTYGGDQSTAEVQERQAEGLNAGIVQAKTDYDQARARGDAKGMAEAHRRAEDLRRQGGIIASAETAGEAKLHLQAEVDRHITQDKARWADGMAVDQRLAHLRAEEARALAEAQGVQTIGIGDTLTDARERAQAEANRQVLIDKAVYDRAQAAGDMASVKLAHQDAEAQRTAGGAVIGQAEDQQQAWGHQQRVLDTGVVTHKDAWDGTTHPAGRDHEHRQAEMLRSVGQSVGVATIGQDVSLADAQVRLVLEGGPLVAGGKATEVEQSDAAALRVVQLAIDNVQPDVQTMRDLFQRLQSRANVGDASAAATLAVLQIQADKSGVDLNPPPPPPLVKPDLASDEDEQGRLSAEDIRLRTAELQAEVNYFATLNAGEDARLRADAEAPQSAVLSKRDRLEVAYQQALRDSRADTDELLKIWKANQRWAAMYIVPEGALVKGGQVVVEGAEAAVAALQKSDEGGALVSRAKGFVGRISEWLYRTWRNGVTPMEGSPISSTYCLPAVQQGQQALLDGAVGHDVISAGMTVATAQDVGVTGIVWDAVEATQPMYEGTPIPKSFTLTTMNGRIWVHGNATKHLAQYVLSAANHSADVSLTSQLLLRSLQGAVDEALKAGVSYDELKVVDGWELVFSASRSEGLLPVLKHALYIGK